MKDFRVTEWWSGTVLVEDEDRVLTGVVSGWAAVGVGGRQVQPLWPELGGGTGTTGRLWESAEGKPWDKASL